MPAKYYAGSFSEGGGESFQNSNEYPTRGLAKILGRRKNSLQRWANIINFNFFATYIEFG